MIIPIILIALFVWFVARRLLARDFDEIADEKGIEFEDNNQ